MRSGGERGPWLDIKWALIFLAYLGNLVMISILAYRSKLLGLLTQFDKLGHFVLFGSAGLLAHLALNRRAWSFGRLSIPAGPLLIALIVILDELGQCLSDNRTAGISDLIANWLGIIAFVAVFKFWQSAAQKLNRFRRTDWKKACRVEING